MPLPFRTAPQQQTRVVGDSTIGELVFPVHGALLAGERLAIDEVDYEAVLFEQTARLADVLAHMDGLDEIEANLIAVRILSGRIGIRVQLNKREQRIRLREAALIAQVEGALRQASQKQTIRTVTAAIRFRLGQPDWSDQDTMAEVPEPLRDAIYGFMLDEQAGDRATQDEESLLKDLADTLGKLAAANQHEPRPTGESSTGAAETSGPMTPPSTPSASPTAARPTSRRRSKTAAA